MNDEAKNVFDACEQRVELYSNTTNLDKNFFESDVLCLPPSSAPDGATFTRAGFKGGIGHRFRKQNRGAQLRFAVKSTHDGSFHPFTCVLLVFFLLSPRLPSRHRAIRSWPVYYYTRCASLFSLSISFSLERKRERDV